MYLCLQITWPSRSRWLPRAELAAWLKHSWQLGAAECCTAAGCRCFCNLSVDTLALCQRQASADAADVLASETVS